MKSRFLLVALITFSFTTNAQSKFPAPDNSPMDMSYCPANYPIAKIQEKLTEPLVARITYSRPQKKGRTIFGDLVDYSQVWRLGANEATEIEFFKDVKIGTSHLPTGRYTMYAIPGETKWTIIINSDNDTWGAFKYDAKKDILRIDVPVLPLTDPLESFSLYFDKTNTGYSLNIGWDQVMVSMPFTLAPAGSKTTKTTIKKKY